MKCIKEINILINNFIEYKSDSIELENQPYSHDKIINLINNESQYNHDSIKFLPLDRLNPIDEKELCLKVINNVVDSGNFTSGPYIQLVENIIKEYYTAKYCIATSSGTDAIKIGLIAAGIKAGDEVIVPLNSFAATENAIFSIGASPVYANIDESFNIIPSEIERLITKRTKAVLPVCLYGSTKNIRDVFALAKKYNIKTLIDAAQCFGVTDIIKHCDFLFLSFNPFKNIGSFGKSGAILTNSDEGYSRSRQISYHGFFEGKKNIKSINWGYNCRMDNLQAATLHSKINYFEHNAIKRTYLAHRYLKELKKLNENKFKLPIETIENTWHLFPLIVDENKRDQLVEFAKKRNIEFDVYYPVLSHKHETDYAKNYLEPIQFEKSEQLHSSLVHIPLHNHMSIYEQDKIIEVIHDFFK